MLGRIHRGELRLVARDTPEPSLFAHEILNARPYAFLDDAPLEERRSHAVQSRRATEPASAGDLGALDAEAIARVRDEERPDPRDADELHDALLTAGFLTARRAGRRRGRSCSTQLTARGAPVARRLDRVDAGVVRVVVAAERLPELRAIHPDAGRRRVARSRRRRGWRSVDARRRDRRGRCAAGSR